jgi:hypothetical protein
LLSLVWVVIRRNINKAILALGDIQLVFQLAYHWSLAEKYDRLLHQKQTCTIPWMQRSIGMYGEAVEFKLHPYKDSNSEKHLRLLLKEVLDLCREAWLFTAEKIYHTPYPTLDSFIADPRNKCPEKSIVKNLAVNCRAFGINNLWNLQGKTRYPRERIANALSVLLWTPSDSFNSGTQKKLQNFLNTKATDYTPLVNSYQRLWHLFG